MKPEDRWQNLASQFRNQPDPDQNSEAPLGFATRVVALSHLTDHKKSSILTRFRNWSLATAGLTAGALALTLALQKPTEQFLPLPEAELPTPTSR